MGVGKRNMEKAAMRWRIVSYTVLFFVSAAMGWLGMLLLT
jgi:hypothetical protein